MRCACAWPTTGAASTPPSRPPASALAGMRERAALMGGELEIETSAAGTAVTATFPL